MARFRNGQLFLYCFIFFTLIHLSFSHQLTKSFVTMHKQGRNKVSLMITVDFSSQTITSRSLSKLDEGFESLRDFQKKLTVHRFKMNDTTSCFLEQSKDLEFSTEVDYLEKVKGNLIRELPTTLFISNTSLSTSERNVLGSAHITVFCEGVEIYTLRPENAVQEHGRHKRSARGRGHQPVKQRFHGQVEAQVSPAEDGGDGPEAFAIASPNAAVAKVGGKSGYAHAKSHVTVESDYGHGKSIRTMTASSTFSSSRRSSSGAAAGAQLQPTHQGGQSRQQVSTSQFNNHRVPQTIPATSNGFSHESHATAAAASSLHAQSGTQGIYGSSGQASHDGSVYTSSEPQKTYHFKVKYPNGYNVAHWYTGPAGSDNSAGTIEGPIESTPLHLNVPGPNGGSRTVISTSATGGGNLQTIGVGISPSGSIAQRAHAEANALLATSEGQVQQVAHSQYPIRNDQHSGRQPVQQNVVQTPQQTVRQPIQQTVRQPVQQTGRQPIQQTVRQSVQQTGRQHVQQTVVQPIPQDAAQYAETSPPQAVDNSPQTHQIISSSHVSQQQTATLPRSNYPIQQQPTHLVQPIQQQPSHQVQPIQQQPTHLVQPIQQQPSHIVQPTQQYPVHRQQPQIHRSTNGNVVTYTQETLESQHTAGSSVSSGYQENQHYQHNVAQRYSPVQTSQPTSAASQTVITSQPIPAHIQPQYVRQGPVRPQQQVSQSHQLQTTVSETGRASAIEAMAKSIVMNPEPIQPHVYPTYPAQQESVLQPDQDPLPHYPGNLGFVQQPGVHLVANPVENPSGVLQNHHTAHSQSQSFESSTDYAHQVIPVHQPGSNGIISRPLPSHPQPVQQETVIQQQPLPQGSTPLTRPVYQPAQQEVQQKTSGIIPRSLGTLSQVVQQETTVHRVESGVSPSSIHQPLEVKAPQAGNQETGLTHVHPTQQGINIHQTGSNGIAQRPVASARQPVQPGTGELTRPLVVPQPGRVVNDVRGEQQFQVVAGRVQTGEPGTRVLQPGQTIPELPGLSVPQGFRGRVVLPERETRLPNPANEQTTVQSASHSRGTVHQQQVHLQELHQHQQQGSQVVQASRTNYPTQEEYIPSPQEMVDAMSEDYEDENANPQDPCASGACDRTPHTSASGPGGLPNLHHHGAPIHSGPRGQRPGQPGQPATAPKSSDSSQCVYPAYVSCNIVYVPNQQSRKICLPPPCCNPC